MLLQKLTRSDTEAERKRWKIVLRSSGRDVAGDIVAADCESGDYTVMEAAEEKTVSTYPQGIAIVARIAILALLGGFALGLAGCAATQKVQMFAAGDLANAAAIAQASGDQNGAQCWSGLGPVAMATPNPQADGLATKAERLRVLRQELTGPCGGVLAQAILDAQAAKSSVLTLVAPIALP